MSLEREVYTHCLHLPPVNSFAIKLSFSHSPLFSEVTSDLLVAEFDGYLIYLFVCFCSFLSLECLTVSNIFKKLLWRISNMYKCRENKWYEGQKEMVCHIPNWHSKKKTEKPIKRKKKKKKEIYLIISLNWWKTWIHKFKKYKISYSSWHWSIKLKNIWNKDFKRCKRQITYIV